MTENNRIEWLDVFKGITILLVVLGHSRSEMNYLSRICVGCHMPIFFFTGGLTLHKYGTFFSNVQVKAKALLYPYVTGSLLTILFFWNEKVCVLEESLRFTGYGVLWFLPTLFMAEILVLLFIEKEVCSKYLCMMYLILLWCIRDYMTDYSDRWYLYMLLRTVVASFFVYTGYLTKNIFLNYRNRILLIPGGVFI